MLQKVVKSVRQAELRKLGVWYLRCQEQTIDITELEPLVARAAKLTELTLNGLNGTSERNRAILLKLAGEIC